MFNDIHIKTFNDLKSKIRKGEFTILINDVIIHEWNRNIIDTKQLIKELKNVKNNNERIIRECKFIDNSRLSLLLDEGDKKIDDLIKKQEQHITNVTTFLNNIKKKVLISDDLKIRVINLALEKQVAPFHNDKNNIADALILYSALDFIKDKESNDSLIFVTYNFKDFCESREKATLHQSLSFETSINKITIEFNLARALESDASLIETIDNHNDYRLAEHLVFDWLEKEYFNDNLETNVKIGMNECDALIERQDSNYRIGFEIKFSVNRSLQFALNQLERLLQITSFNEFNIIIVGQDSPNRKGLFVNNQLASLSEFYGLTINIIFGKIVNGVFKPN